MSWVGIDFVPFDCTKNHVKLVFEVIPAQAQLLVQFLLGTAVGIKHINIISGRRIVRVKQKNSLIRIGNTHTGLSHGYNENSAHPYIV